MGRKAIKRRIFGFVLGILVMINSLFVPAEVRASGSYNSASSLSYAKDHWNDGVGLCSEFVSNCLTAGGCSAWSTSCTALRRQLVNSGLGTEYELNLEADMTIKGSNYSDRLAPGDVVFYYCPGCTDGKPYIHVVLCNGIDRNGYMLAFAHNARNSGQTKYKYNSRCYACGTKISKAYVYHFNSCHNPIGCIDEVSAGYGNITVSGWALDEDSPSKGLDIHVYVGKPAAAGTSGYIISADKNRDDVDKVYGLGRNHGFSETIQVKERGTKTIYLYAINADGGENTYLGSRTVNIKEAFIMGFQKEKINIEVGETTSVQYSFKGDGIYTMSYAFETNGIAQAVAWGETDWTNGKSSIDIKGIQSGNTKLIIKLLDDNLGTLYEKSISIVVNDPKKNMDNTEDRNKEAGEKIEKEETYQESEQQGQKSVFEKAITYTEQMIDNGRKMGLSEESLKKYVKRLLEKRGWGKYVYLVDMM